MPNAISDPLTTIHRGYACRLLRVDLTNRDFTVEAITEEALRFYLGAKGLAARLLVDNFPARADPLGPDNPLIIATGPFQGSPVSSAGRAVMVTRSPLTTIFLDSYFGGDFGHLLKRAGFDALLLTGAADRPTTVHITPQGAEFAPAEGLWGKGIRATEAALIRDRPASRVLSIGPAGENRVPIACAISSLRRAAGRGGTGAVMGAKKLKAITVEGDAVFAPADPSVFNEQYKKINNVMKQARKDDHPFYRYGTTQTPPFASRTDRLPTRNYQSAQFEDADALAGPAIHAGFAMGTAACCSPCPIACTARVKEDSIGQTSGGKASGGKDDGDDIEGANGWASEGLVAADRPEYETTGLLGSNLGISDIAAIMEYNELCNDLGLDTISAGGVIGFAIESANRGLLDLPYDFGDPRAARELIPLIAAREGVGDLLGRGVRAAAERLGGDSFKWAVHVKGLELPAWDPRGKLTNGMAYATADIGGSHLREWTPTDRIPDETAVPLMGDLIASQNEKVLRDCYVLCTFAWEATTPTGAQGLFNSITGFDLSQDEFDTAAERIWSLTRAFNNTLFMDRSQDTLCHRLMHDPLPSGPAKGCTAFVSAKDHQDCLDRYYELRGWDENGVVPPERLRELGIQA